MLKVEPKKIVTRLTVAAIILAGFASLPVFVFNPNATPAMVKTRCAAQTLYDYEQNACVPVSDRINEFLNSTDSVKKPPAIHELRKGRNPSFQKWLNGIGIAPLQTSIPIPGGIGSGVLYKNEMLKVFYSANLDTKMIVHPAGLNLPANWLFTTATNRTEQGVEVVGIYYGSSLGDLGIFDWSCSPTSPCSRTGDTVLQGPSWIWTKQFSDLSCYYRLRSDGSNQARQNILRYSNRAYRSDATDPMAWQNDVYLWNYCYQMWDQVYTHSYKAVQKDCSINNACGWWGPIVETFFDTPQPAIKKIGFHQTELFIDDITSGRSFSVENTSWVPPAPEWNVLHRSPNTSWGVGSTNLTVSVESSFFNSFLIIVKDTGPAGAKNVRLRIDFSEGAKIYWLSLSQGSCNTVNNTTRICSLGYIEAGKSIQIQVNASGINKIRAVVDPQNKIFETNENDNIAEYSLSI